MCDWCPSSALINWNKLWLKDYEFKFYKIEKKFKPMSCLGQERNLNESILFSQLMTSLLFISIENNDFFLKILDTFSKKTVIYNSKFGYVSGKKNKINQSCKSRYIYIYILTH